MNQLTTEILNAQRIKHREQPFNYVIQPIQETKNFTFSEIYYDSWSNKRVKASLIEPVHPQEAPALIFANPFAEKESSFLPDAISLAQAGFVSLVIEAPFKRTGNYFRDIGLKQPEIIKANYLQWIGDIIRGCDFFSQTGIGDASKLGFVGRHTGAAIAGILTAVEDRIQISIVQSGIPELSKFWESDDYLALRKGGGQS